jgi:hypothetical protein
VVEKQRENHSVDRLPSTLTTTACKSVQVNGAATVSTLLLSSSIAGESQGFLWQKDVVLSCIISFLIKSNFMGFYLCHGYCCFGTNNYILITLIFFSLPQPWSPSVYFNVGW